MNKPKLLVVAHTNLGSSLSGGDRIFLNLIKQWSPKISISTAGSEETDNLLHKFKIQSPFIKTSKANKIRLNTANLIYHHLSRLITGFNYCIKHRDFLKQFDYIYTASDFYGDFVFGVFAKIFHPQVKWLCGYYLLSPPPWSPASPHRLNHQFFRGFVYYIAQIPTRLIARLFADFVLVTSEPDLEYFPNKSLIIQGGVAIPSSKALASLKPLKKRFYDAFYLGRLHSQKGVVGLIDIWKLVVEKIPSAKLVIVGDGELYQLIKNKIKKLQLSHNISLKGFMVGRKKFNLIKSSKIVVHPATYDSGGMAAAEAMAYGLPGVSYDLPALRTYYPYGMIKTPPSNQIIFAENIIKLLTDKTYYSRQSRLARKLILKQWSWEKRFAAVFNQVFKP